LADTDQKQWFKQPNSDQQSITASVMACADPILQLDDQSFALQLQCEEIEAQRELQSGKWAEDSPPDYALAFDDFEAKLKKATILVEDLKLAHSIAKAVDSDAVAIEELRVEETQSVQYRDFAVSLNEDENQPSQDVSDLPGMPRIARTSSFSSSTLFDSTRLFPSRFTIDYPDDRSDAGEESTRLRRRIEFLPSPNTFNNFICNTCSHLNRTAM